MYAYLRGKITYLEPTTAVVDVHNIGYKVAIPLSVSSALTLGSEVTFFTSFVIREFFQGLYGFLEESERDLFETLIEISGVGPKTALNLIGHLPLEKLQEVILAEDTNALSKVPGIGKKTAERLLVELKNKLNILETPAKKTDPKNQSIQDAIKALVRLGYNAHAAHKAIKKALPDDSKDAPEVGILITTALRHI